MSVATTDEIRLTQIPGELRRLRAEVDHWRQQHAIEFTRAEAAERRAKKAAQSAEDWQAIALHNGYEAADARLEAARERHGREATHVLWAREVAGDCADIAKLQTELDAAKSRAFDLLCALQGVLDSIDLHVQWHDALRESVGRVLDEYQHLIERCEACGGFDADREGPACERCWGGSVLIQEVK